MAGLYSHTTRASGLTLTAAIYNADHQNHIDNMDPDQMDDESVDVTAMRVTTDPGEVGTESLPTSLQGELQRLRNIIKEITGEAQWYVTPRGDLDAAAGIVRSVTESITISQVDRGRLLAVDTTDGNITITLATNLVTQGYRVGFKKISADVNSIIVSPGVTAHTIELATELTMDKFKHTEWIRSDDSIWYVESVPFGKVIDVPRAVMIGRFTVTGTAGAVLLASITGINLNTVSRTSVGNYKFYSNTEFDPIAGLIANTSPDTNRPVRIGGLASDNITVVMNAADFLGVTEVKDGASIYITAFGKLVT